MTSSIRRHALAGVIATFALPLAADAQQFEGVISMRITGSGPAAGQVQDAEYHASRAGKARISLNTPMGKAAMIIAPAEGRMYLLLEQVAQYVERDISHLNAPQSPNADMPKIVRTGKKETIAGYECEHLEIDGLDVCATNQLGSYMNFGGDIMLRGAMQPWQSAIVKDKLFPLKVVLPDGTVQVLVTKVEKKAVEAAMFRVPESYTKVPLPERGG